ncbi:MAG: hypothetical protein JWP58_1358 [Hymenobacter sp.]|nr:hypothetical protein [Hymenobacter sp.]
MNKQQTARWNRQLKIKQVRQDHPDATVGGLVTRAFARHDALLATADALMTTPAGRSTGATLKKSTEEKHLVEVVLPFANALHLLYLETGDVEKAHALRLFKNDYEALAGALLLAETRNVAQQAADHDQVLAEEADLDLADRKELDAANTAFAGLLAAPKVAIETGKTANADLRAALRAADVFVKKELTPAVELLKRKQPKFYNALREAMRVDNAPGPRGTDDAAPAPNNPAT